MARTGDRAGAGRGGDVGARAATRDRIRTPGETGAGKAADRPNPPRATRRTASHEAVPEAVAARNPVTARAQVAVRNQVAAAGAGNSVDDVVQENETTSGDRGAIGPKKVNKRRVGATKGRPPKTGATTGRPPKVVVVTTGRPPKVVVVTTGRPPKVVVVTTGLPPKVVVVTTGLPPKVGVTEGNPHNGESEGVGPVERTKNVGNPGKTNGTAGLPVQSAGRAVRPSQSPSATRR